MTKIGLPDKVSVKTEKTDINDASLRFENKDGKINVFLKAQKSHPRFIELVWNSQFKENALFLGDTWERSYGNLAWNNIDNSGSMPWYFLCLEDEKITAVGVMVRPASLVYFHVSRECITAVLDVRCGGCGVELGDRELLAAQFVSREYTGSAFDAACDFCKLMCPMPLLPEKPVYGGNNWYYAYGQSSREDILADAKYQSMLAENLENRPFMVIDDGWQINRCAGPWKSNSKFGDMGDIAREIKKTGVRPGIWVRFLCDDTYDIPMDWYMQDHGKSVRRLDPSLPEVLAHIQSITKQFVSWGYELIKHDFTTYDIFGNYSYERTDTLTDDGWSFHDRSRTSAEITVNLYKTILEAAGESIILGCNTISHLCAGLVHVNRIGDDTSGYDWERTYRYGVNTLAFRLPQNNSFYAVDADCVGFKGIAWEKNKQWLKLLSVSGSPLFISCPYDGLDKEQFQQMKSAYKNASIQNDRIEPVDWFDCLTPRLWELNKNKKLSFEW